MEIFAFKRLSKAELAWFGLVLALLIFSIAMAILILVVTVNSIPNLSPKHVHINLHSKTPYIVNFAVSLPKSTEPDKVPCVGTVVRKNLILTSARCLDNFDRIKFRGKTYNVEMVHGSVLNSASTPKKQKLVIKHSNRQLKLLQMDDPLTAVGFSIVKMPPLNYSVVHNGLGTMLYFSGGKIKASTVSFVHPYYCKVVYESLNYTIDFNSMICAIMLYEKTRTKLCLNGLVGSPLIQNDILVGILTVSSVPTCGEVYKPFVFVNIIPYLQWFQTHEIPKI